jgi:hypothetical protein
MTLIKLLRPPVPQPALVKGESLKFAYRQSESSNSALETPDCLMMLLQRTNPQFAVVRNGNSCRSLRSTDLHDHMAAALAHSFESVAFEDLANCLAR